MDGKPAIAIRASRSVPSASERLRLALFALLGLYLIIGTLYAIYTPAWQVPDEPAHYNYVRHVAEHRALPTLQVGDYNQAYLSELTSTGFPPDKPIDSLRYENHQPPLYYLLAAPVFLAFDGALIPLRLLSLFIGVGVVVFAFLAAWAAFPGDYILALAAAGFIAFLPQHTAMMAGVNNDGLAELLVAGGLWLVLRGTATVRSRVILGLVIGAAFLTKATAYVLAPVIAAGLLLAARREGWGWKRLAQAAAWAFLPALLIGGWWWGRNIAVYGWPDFLGLARHNAVVVGQPRTAEWLAELGWGEYLRRFFVTTFRSFWGQFGWMGVVMDSRVYWALLAFCLTLAAGFIYAVATHRKRPAPFAPVQRAGVAALTLLVLLVAAQYLYYNLTFVQHQGRYLFPALLPLGVAVAIGLAAWASLAEGALRARRTASPPPVAGDRPAALAGWLPLVAIALLAALDLFALFRVIVPALPRY